MKRVLVLGIGNPLCGDDGVGIKVIEYLNKNTHFPQGVKVQDGGTGALMLLGRLGDYDNIIIVDAMESGKDAGSITRCVPKEVRPVSRHMASLHGVSFADMLKLTLLIDGRLPSLVIIGIQPKCIERGAHLSQEVEASIPTVAAMVATECKRVLSE